MRDAAAEITAIARTQTLTNYQTNKQFRWSVERGFEIIGEALSQLAKFDDALADKISERRKIISFRNILIHGYSKIDHAKTWDIVQQDLPTLLRELDQLLK